MNFGWFKRSDRKTPPDVSDFDISPEEMAAASAVPLESEVKAVRLDYLQTIIALGRANAKTRRILAEQTLLNVQGKMRHATQHH